MNDDSIESLLRSLEPPALAPGHHARLRARLANAAASVGDHQEMRHPGTPRRHVHVHGGRSRRLLSWTAMAALVLGAAAIAVRAPRVLMDQDARQSLPFAVEISPVIFSVDLFPARHQAESIDIRRWSTR